MHAPTVILEVVEPRVDCRAFVESPVVLLDQVGLDAERPVLLGAGLGLPVRMGGDDDHGVKVRVIMSQGYVEHVVEADTNRHGFQPQVIRNIFRWRLRVGNRRADKLVRFVHPSYYQPNERMPIHSSWPNDTLRSTYFA